MADNTFAGSARRDHSSAGHDRIPRAETALFAFGMDAAMRISVRSFIIFGSSNIGLPANARGFRRRRDPRGG